MLIIILSCEIMFSISCAIITWSLRKFVTGYYCIHTKYKTDSHKFRRAFKYTYLLYFEDEHKKHTIVIPTKVFLKLRDNVNEEITLYKITYRYWWANPNGSKTQYSLNNETPNEYHKKSAIKVFMFLSIVLLSITVIVYLGL